MTSRTMTSVALAATLLLAITGCTNTPSPSGVESADRKPLDLAVGALLPETGSLAAFGPAATAAVQLAAGDINNADLGITVTVTSADSGDSSTDTSVDSAKTLIDAGVSVIVGAISDNVSRKVIDQIVKAGVVQISPGNTSTDFTRADDEGLYFRTAPSCVLEGDAMGRQIAADGVKTLGLIYQTGFCEPGLPEALTAAFERAGGKVVAQQAYAEGASDLSAQVTAVAAEKPAAAVVVGGSAVASVPPLVAAGYEGSDLYFVGLSIADHSADIAAGSITGSIASMPGLDISKLNDFTDRLLDVNPAPHRLQLRGRVVRCRGSRRARRPGWELDRRPGYRREAARGLGRGGQGHEGQRLPFRGAGHHRRGSRRLRRGLRVDITFDAKGDPQGAVIGLYRYRADNTFQRID